MCLLVLFSDVPGLPFCTRSCAAVTFFFLGPGVAFSAFCCCCFCALVSHARLVLPDGLMSCRTMDHIFNILTGSPQADFGRVPSRGSLVRGEADSRERGGVIGERRLMSAKQSLTEAQCQCNDDGICVVRSEWARSKVDCCAKG